METQQDTVNTVTQQPIEPKPNSIRLEFKKQHILALSLGIVTALILGGLFFAKGLFIAATVNGSPVSRLAVISELEKQEGKLALESIISKRLIQAELKKNKIVVSEADIDTEIKKIEEEVAAQGSTLEQALTLQGISMDMLRDQIATQKGLERLLADKVSVTDSEVETALKDAGASLPEDINVDDLKTEMREQLKQNKFQQEVQKFISELTANADIKYFVTY